MSILLGETSSIMEGFSRAIVDSFIYLEARVSFSNKIVLLSHTVFFTKTKLKTYKFMYLKFLNLKWIENYSMAYQISNILAFLFSCDACTHNNDKWAIYYCIILHNTI